MIIYIVLTTMGVFAIWSVFYAHNVKKRGINKLVNNIKEYEQKKRQNKCKTSSFK
jgi:uncharacterized protein YxeA